MILIYVYLNTFAGVFIVIIFHPCGDILKPLPAGKVEEHNISPRKNTGKISLLLPVGINGVYMGDCHVFF